MITILAEVALLVREYDEAIAFYCGKLGFTLLEDTLLPAKRWVRLRPPGESGAGLVLSRAIDREQLSVVGKQAGGRVFLFLHTSDLDSDYRALEKSGIVFSEGPTDHAYGRVAVFEDLYGNRIDLIEPPGTRAQ